MTDREKVIKGLSAHKKGNCAEKDCPYYWDNEDGCLKNLFDDALELLKEQEQEISRLKHHIDCDAAEKLPSGCVGYGRSYYDDEPCDTCKKCEKYNGYEDEKGGEVG